MIKAKNDKRMKVLVVCPECQKKHYVLIHPLNLYRAGKGQLLCLCLECILEVEK